MFEIDHNLTYLGVTRDQVLLLMQSINAVSVKVPGIAPEPATAYVVGWSLGGGRAAALIYLHYQKSNQACIYVREPRVFPTSDMGEVGEEAALFLESMGFMLDDTGFSALSAQQQDRLMAQAPVFYKSLAEFKAAREASADAPEVVEADLVESVDEAEPIEAAEQAQAAPSAPAVPARASGVGVAAAGASHGGVSRERIGRMLVSF